MSGIKSNHKVKITIYRREEQCCVESQVWRITQDRFCSTLRLQKHSSLCCSQMKFGSTNRLPLSVCGAILNNQDGGAKSIIASTDESQSTCYRSTTSGATLQQTSLYVKISHIFTMICIFSSRCISLLTFNDHLF